MVSLADMIDKLDQKAEKTTILVVEDDAHLLTGIQDILELEQYHVLTAKNGQDGLRVLRENPDNPPDVIVSDIMMPHMSGFEFLEAVRQEDRWIEVPFIFLTAKGERKDKHRGSLMGADVYLTKPFDAEDLLVAVSSQLRRKTERTRVKVDEVSRIKREILTILHHEFRTPLTLVVAYDEMLKDVDTQNMSSEEIMLFLRGVSSGADRLRRLIENFITLIELREGDAEKTCRWRKQPIDDIHLLINDALRQVEQPHQRPRKFTVEVADEMPIFVADSIFLTVVIRELLDNAAKFSRDNDPITLTCTADDEAIEIRVTDVGRGIPEHELENIWEPFYQIDREEYEDQGGGNGLAIVDGIVELHGGTCEIHSKVVEGTTVVVRLPINPPEDTETS